MICPYCGFQNEAGDEFCGNCGKYLGFDAGKAAEGTTASTNAGVTGAGAAGAAGAAGIAGAAASGTGAPPGNQGGGSPPAGQPTPPPPPPPIPTGPPGPMTMGSAGWAGGPPDVICWNCGRRNPGSRAFCLQCGQKLTASAPAAGGGGAAMVPGGAGAAAGGGGGGRLIPILAALVVGLLLIGVGAFVFFGLLGSRPAPSGVAGASSSPGASASGLFPSGSAGSSLGFPSPTIPGETLAPFTEPPMTSTPKPMRTPRPTCDATGQPPGCKPSPTPSPTPTPSTPATPVNCSLSTAPNRSVTLTETFPTRTIPEGFAWCVHDITFTNTSQAGATGTLQLFLENPEYIGPPGNYGMAKIGWPGPASASIENNFTGSVTYHPTWEYPFGYDALTAGTIVSFEIVGCGTNGTCHGTVTIDFERIAAP